MLIILKKMLVLIWKNNEVQVINILTVLMIMNLY